MVANLGRQALQLLDDRMAGGAVFGNAARAQRAAAGFSRRFRYLSSEPRSGELQIAVVIPAYQEAERIGAVLDSLEREGAGYRAKAYAVVNGSPETYEAAKAAARPEDVVYDQPKMGVSNARNHGAEQALRDGADAIVFLDGDSTLNRGTLERVARSVRSGASWGYGEVKGVGAAAAYYKASNLLSHVMDPLRIAGWLAGKPLPMSGSGTFTYATADALRALRAQGPLFDQRDGSQEDFVFAQRMQALAGPPKPGTYIDGAVTCLTTRRSDEDGKLRARIPLFGEVSIPGGPLVGLLTQAERRYEALRGKPLPGVGALRPFLNLSEQRYYEHKEAA